VALDEPTNYIDMETLDSLAKGLNRFKGAVMVISHSSEFVDRVCEETWTVANGQVARNAPQKKKGPTQKAMAKAIVGTTAIMASHLSIRTKRTMHVKCLKTCGILLMRRKRKIRKKSLLPWKMVTKNRGGLTFKKNGQELKRFAIRTVTSSSPPLDRKDLCMKQPKQCKECRERRQCWI
jgi:energy-coupling factor transporter ATP-binding protein EcfA2